MLAIVKEAVTQRADVVVGADNRSDTLGDTDSGVMHDVSL